MHHSLTRMIFCPFSAAPGTSNNAEMDLLGSLSDSFPSNALAIVPTTSEADAYTNSAPAPAFAAAVSTPDVLNEVHIIVKMLCIFGILVLC